VLAVVVEDDGFEEAAGSVSADIEVTVALIEHPDGVAYRVLDVEVDDAVFTGVVRDLHRYRLPCPGVQGKLPCPPRGLRRPEGDRRPGHTREAWRQRCLYSCHGIVKAVARVSSKNQVTLPVAALRAAGLEAGDEVTVRPIGAGEIVIAARGSRVRRHAGIATGIYEPGELDRLRDEWDR